MLGKGLIFKVKKIKNVFNTLNLDFFELKNMCIHVIIGISLIPMQVIISF